MLLIRQKQKNSKRPKRIWMKTWLKNRKDKGECVNIFSELLITDKFWHYFQMNATYHTTEYIEFYTLFINLILLTLIIIQHIFTICYSTRFSFLEIKHYYATKTTELMTRQVVFFEKLFHWTKFLVRLKISFSESFHRRLKNSLIGI